VPKISVADAFKTYGERLTNFIRKRVSSTEDAEDILSEVFYQLSRMDNLAKPVEQVSAWLYRVARNRIINWYAKKKNEPLLVSSDDEDNDILTDISEVLFTGDTTPETKYLRSLVLSEIEAVLAELPPEQREIFEQTEFLGLPVKEISKITGTPVNTLLSRKHYAVVHLRKQLKHLYGEIVEKNN
jgi:RNA polymerase sigma factor (sigma-70 family)